MCWRIVHRRQLDKRRIWQFESCNALLPQLHERHAERHGQFQSQFQCVCLLFGGRRVFWRWHWQPTTTQCANEPDGSSELTLREFESINRSVNG
jgi:hypothetical protein